MKFIVALLFLLPIAATAQTVTDYNKVMKKFQQFYNAGQGDSIKAMSIHFPDSIRESTSFWSNKHVANILDEFGTLKSFKFIGTDSTDQKVYVFKTVFSKVGSKTTSLNIDEEYHIGTFRFSTTSEGITALLNNSKPKNKAIANKPLQQ